MVFPVVHQMSAGPESGPVTRTAEDFVADLRRLRAQAGNPSFRQLYRIAGKRIADAPGECRLDPLPPSTTSEVLSGKRLPRLPRLEFVESFVTACLSSSGMDEPAVTAEVGRWRDRWRSLATPEKVEQPPPAPRRRSAVPLLMVVVFVAGLGVGIVGTLWWTAEKPSVAAAESPDVCLPPAATPPAGEDVLKLPPAGQETGSWWVNDKSSAELSTDGRRFEATVAAGTSRPGDVLIVKSNVALVEGRSYTVAFSAAADRSTTIRVRVQDSRPPTFQSSYDRELTVTPGACRHLYQFVATRTSTHSELTFQVGGQAQDFELRVTDTHLVADPA